MLSVVCVYNNTEIYKKYLKKSLDMQENCDFELIEIDNNRSNYRSASEALNAGGMKAKGDFILFVHQDVCFSEASTLHQIEQMCLSEDFGIAGVAGASSKDGRHCVLSNIVQGPDKTRNYMVSIDTAADCDTLDECLLIIPHDIFVLFPFRYTGDVWHLYGTEYALRMHDNQKRVVVMPVKLWHRSEGDSINHSYFVTLQKICRQYRHLKAIYTIFGKYHTSSIRCFMECSIKELKIHIRGVALNR
jgi:hypothetical protein